MSVTVLPYLTGSSVSQASASKKQAENKIDVSNLKNINNFKDVLSAAERTLQAMSVDALLEAEQSGMISSAEVQKLLGFNPQSSVSGQTAASASDTAADVSGTANTSSADSFGGIKCPDELVPYFKEAAEKYNIDINLLMSVARAESGFRTDAKSSAGAMGVMQLMPSTAKGLGIDNAYDPHANILGGAKLLASNLKKYNGDISLALAAYNCGGGTVAKYGGVPPFKETQNYIAKVLEYYKNAQ